MPQTLGSAAFSVWSKEAVQDGMYRYFCINFVGQNYAFTIRETRLAL